MYMELLIFAGGFIVGFICGDLYAIHRVRKLITKVINGEITPEEVEQEKSKIAEPIYLTVEITNGIMYLFDTNDNFICQGESLTDLAMFAMVNKKIEYAKVKNGDDIVYFIKGAVASAVNLKA